MNQNFKWKTKKGQFDTGESLYLNRIRLGGFSWNSARTHMDKSTSWVGSVTLPSLTNNRVYGATPEEIKPQMEKIVTEWFDEATRRTQ